MRLDGRVCVKKNYSCFLKAMLRARLPPLNCVALKFSQTNVVSTSPRRRCVFNTGFPADTGRATLSQRCLSTWLDVLIRVDSMTVAHKTVAHKTVAHKTIAHRTTAHNLNGKQDNCSQHIFFMVLFLF